ncbi:YegP family protein [Williamsia sp. R60]
MYFSVGTTKAGEPSWWLYGNNHEKVAWAGETFASSYNADRAAKAFKAGARTATYDVYADAGGHWRWRAIRGGNKVASSGESFASRSNAERAANNVRDNAGSATGL